MNDLDARLRRDLPDLADALLAAGAADPARPGHADVPLYAVALDDDGAAGPEGPAARSRATHRRADRGTRRVGWRPLAAVALAAAAVVAGIAVAARPTANGWGSADPDAPLFVLPPAASGVTLTAGHVEAAPPPGQPGGIAGESVVVGRRRGDAFVDLWSIRVSTEAPPEAGMTGASTVDTADGPVTVVGGAGGDSSAVTAVMAERDGRWVTVSTRPDRLAEALALLPEVSIDGAGRPVVADRRYEVVARAGGVPYGATVYAEVAGSAPSEGMPLSVETIRASAGALLAGVAPTVDELAPTQVDGRPAWIIRRDGARGEADWYGVAVEVGPDAFVAVSGHRPPAELRALVATLRPVDEASWRAAVGLPAA